MPLGIHHVEIYVSDLVISHRFYDWLLPQIGFSLDQEWPQGFTYLYGTHYLTFVQTEARFLSDGYHRCRTGLNHLAFHAPSFEILDLIKAQAPEKQVTELYSERYPFASGTSTRCLFLEDPDRIKIELVFTD